MGLPQVNSCCGCINLRTGCIIIGILVAFFSVGVIFKPAGTVYDTQHQGNPLNVIPPLAWTIDAVLNLIFAILLLVGVNKAKAEFFLPYIFLSVVEIIVYLILTVLCLFASFGQGGGNAFAWAVSMFIGLAFKFYFFLVVNSHYNEVNNK